MLLNIGGDEDGLNLIELTAAVILAPIKKLTDGLRVGCAGVFVADGCRKEFNEAPSGILAGARDRITDRPSTLLILYLAR